MLVFANLYFFTLTFSSLLTIGIKCLVIYLILLYSPKNMNRYRVYLILGIGYEIFYTILIGFLLQGYPIGSQCEPSVMFTGLFVLLFRVDGARVGLSFFYGGFALVAIGQTVCLFYRYLVFHSNYQNFFLFVFGKRRIRLIHAVLYGGVIAIAYFGASELPLSTVNTEFDTVGVYLNNGEKKADNLKMIGLVLLMLFLWEVLYFVMVARILNLMQFQTKVATFSPNTIRLHRQLSYLLLLQAISPLFCAAVPIILAGLDKIMPDKCFGYQRIQFSFLMLIVQMASSSILTIVCVKPYRIQCKVLIRDAVVKGMVFMRIRVEDAEQTQAPVASISNNTHSQTI